MGLSASQARLLSITQRINNNELESEMLSHAKIQLSSRNTLASEKYINALDGTKLQYISYDDTGTQEKVDLTFNSINQYTPLKNQYALFNNENQIYVSATDAANFEKVYYDDDGNPRQSTLYDFLDCYGLFDRGREEYADKKKEYDEQMAEYRVQRDEYDLALAEYETKMTDYQTKLDEYNKKLQDYQKEYQDYLDSLSEPSLYDKFSNIVGTKDTAVGSGSSYCYYYALNGSSGCYLHLLNHLLDFDGSSYGSGTYITTNGKNVIPSGGFGGMGTVPELKEVSDAMNETNADGEYTKICDGDDDLNTADQQNILKAARDAGRAPTEVEILMSDYIENGDGTYSLKSLKQKAIDMYYLIESGLISDQPTMYNMLVNFTDGDMKNLATPPDPPDPFTEVAPTMDIAAPQEPEMPVYTDKIYDKPLAQWYTNLWYIMNGSTTSDELYSVYDEQAEFDYFTVPDAPKTSTTENNNYVIMPDEQAGDADWLQFAINNGLVNMSQATLKNDTNSSNIRWEGIEYSSTSDIYETQDETKIAKAEAEYQKTLTEIQAEDKQLDLEMKKLDTEHSALEKELESIKGVMQKNTERSFSAFSQVNGVNELIAVCDRC